MSTARVEGSDAQDNGLTRELEAELAGLMSPKWHYSGTASVFAGHRDNLLLSAYAPMDRFFAGGSVDALAWRPERQRWEWLGFLNGEVLRYLSPPTGARGEQQWFGHAEGRFHAAPWLRLALNAQGYYQDTVIDLSPEQGLAMVEPVKVAGAMSALAVRIQLPGQVEFEPAAQVHSSRYRDFPGDYDETKHGARLTWKATRHVGVSGAWHERNRRYADRTQYTAGGRALPDTRLRVRQREAEGKLSASWTGIGTWSGNVAAAQLENRDGESGYFDYDQRQLKGHLQWGRGKWELAVETTVRRLEYLVQRVGTGIAPPARTAKYREVAVRTEYALSTSWRLAAELLDERNRSNEEEFRYKDRAMKLSLQRDF